MPYGFLFQSDRPRSKVTTVGHPKRNKAKTKAARRARRSTRR